jgi:hypothetical protein
MVANEQGQQLQHPTLLPPVVVDITKPWRDAVVQFPRIVVAPRAVAEFESGVATRKANMFKLLITSFLLVVVAAPALAKPTDVYPVSCDVLWAAVKDTLNNQNNYAILSANEVEHKVSFIVIGNLTTYTDRVALMARDGGCAMKSSFLQVGSDNSDWRQFDHRLTKSLTKLQAAKPKVAEPTSTGQL